MLCREGSNVVTRKTYYMIKLINIAEHKITKQPHIFINY